jgi:alkylhydroperoxidase family enzyme
MTSRIAPAQSPYAPDVETLLDRLPRSWRPPFLYFRLLARDPRLLKAAIDGAVTYLPGSHLDVRTREILLLRVTARAGGEYEWGMRIHFFAHQAGLTEEEIVATVHGSPDNTCWTLKEQAVMRLADAIEDACAVSDPLWADLSAQFKDEAILEMVQLAGYYRTVAAFANTFRLPLEEGRCRPFPTGDQA